MSSDPNDFSADISALERRLERERERSRRSEQRAVARVSELIDQLDASRVEVDVLREQLVDDRHPSGRLHETAQALWDFARVLDPSSTQSLEGEVAGKTIGRLREIAGLTSLAVWVGSPSVGYTQINGTREDWAAQAGTGEPRNFDSHRMADLCGLNAVTTLPLQKIALQQSLLDSPEVPGIKLTFGRAWQRGELDYLVTCTSSAIVPQEVSEYCCLGVMAIVRGSLVADEIENHAKQEVLDNKKHFDLFSRTIEAFRDIDASNCTELIEGVLGEFSEFYDLGSLIWWEIDERRRQYQRIFTYIQDDYSRIRDVVSTAEFGTRFFLDRLREEGSCWHIPDEPTVLNPSLAGVFPSTSGHSSWFLLAARLSPEPWTSDEFDRLQTLSNLLAIAYDGVQLEAHFKNDERSPMPTVVRDAETLALIGANEAFVEFIGRDIDELRGTKPDFVLYNSLLEIPSDFRTSFEWMFTLAEFWNSREDITATPRIYRTKSGAARFTVTTCTDINSAGEIVNFVQDFTVEAKIFSRELGRVERDIRTNLRNYDGFINQASSLKSKSHGLIMFVGNLDRFRQINEDYGIDAGNEVLQVVGKRLSDFSETLESTRSVSIGRVGSDEFALVFKGPLPRNESEQYARDLIREIAKPVSVRPESGGRKAATIQPSMSLGLINVAPEDDLGMSLIRASGAARTVKERGGQGFEWCTTPKHTASVERHTLELELRKAIQYDEFRVFYQPIVSMATGKVLGAEALVRWQHPRLGLQSPGYFMELAEQTGLAEEISKLVLVRACKECVNWNGPYVSVNLAARQLEPRSQTSQLVRNLLKETELSPSQLKLEVTELSVIRDISGAKETLERLRDYGVAVLLDDFGTGYNAFSYLRNLPVDGLKIDRSFVAGLSGEAGEDPETLSIDAKFVRAITGVTDVFGLSCIAEGVETAGQVKALQHAGVDAAQGFLFHKPMPPSRFRELIAPQES